MKTAAVSVLQKAKSIKVFWSSNFSKMLAGRGQSPRRRPQARHPWASLPNAFPLAFGLTAKLPAQHSLRAEKWGEKCDSILRGKRTRPLSPCLPYK